MESTSVADAAVRADHAEHADLHLEGRRQRRLVPVADGEDGVPRGFHLGRAGRDEPRRHPRRQAVLREGPAPQRLDPRQPRDGVPLRGRRADRRLAGRARTRTSTRPSATRTSRRCWSAGRSTSRLRPSRRRTQLLPHLPNGHQVVLPALGHTTSFWGYEPEAQKAPAEHVLRHWQSRQLAVYAGEGRLHARRHAHRARQGLRRHDARPAGDRAPLAAAAVAPLAEARTDRPQGERPAPVGVHAGARASAAGSAA